MLKKFFGDKRHIADVILIASVILISLSVLLIVNFTREPGSLVRVTVKGEFVAEYPLSVDCEYVINGGTNILVVKEGNQENEKVVALKNALLSETIAEYINNTYAGAVIALS